MPGGDGTGPLGEGKMTGRGLGYCAGFNMPGYINNFPCLRFGLGFRRGFGRRSFRARRMQQIIPITNYPIKMTKEQEKQFLERELEILKEDMKEIEKRLKEISK
ncbi:MAG: DUF5320 domain-containing protein [Candidatus Pacearchaeota archaeon]